MKGKQYCMKKVKVLIAALLLIANTQKAAAQYYFYDNNHYDNPLLVEAGVSVGIMNCLTDIGGKAGLGRPFVKDLNIGNNQLNGSIYIGALYKEAVGLRLEG